MNKKEYYCLSLGFENLRQTLINYKDKDRD